MKRKSGEERHCFISKPPRDNVADKKPKRKPTLGASVAPPTEKADFLTQLQNTFERGVVSAEVDIGGLINEKGGGGSVVTMFGEAERISTGPAGVHDSLIKKMKTIADTFGGKFTTHAPMQANPSDLMPVGRAKAAQLLKESLEYTQKLGGSVMTVHPIGQMEYYFTDPFIGQKMPVNNPFYLAKDKDELKGLFKKFNVNDTLLKEQLTKEWENWVGVLPTVFAERYGAIAAQDINAFSTSAARWKLGELAKKNRNGVQSFLRDASDHINSGLGAGVKAEAMKAVEEIVNASADKQQQLVNTLSRYAGDHEKQAKGLWSKVAMVSLEAIKKDGSRADISPESRRLIQRKGGWDNLTANEQNRINDENRAAHEKVRLEAWGNLMGGEQGKARFGPFDKSEEQIMDSIKDTFRMILKGVKADKGDVLKALKNKKLKIGLENLFPARPEKGYMQGFAYFYEPEHMIKLIKELQAVATSKEIGLPKDIFTLTFDVGHAAASSKGKRTPSQFLKKLKEGGINPEHVHIVGGSGYGHGHIAWGDWLDEVSKMDPGIIAKLQDSGVINIEGGAGLHDVDVTLNALWDKGVPVEAMMAMAGNPDAFTPSLAEYSGFDAAGIKYMKGALESMGYQGSGMPGRAFYSFQNETIGEPMQGAFGGYTAPALFGGGYTIGPGRTSAIWASSQPLLYSSKSGGE
ncbi:MAG: hypothetical protein GOU98_03020 [Candidatus Altiarchaeota archaeon]|nr:hypothetical protein [Candidatus Altiarchaeota archaeon]